MLLKINEIVYRLIDLDITDIHEMFCPYGLVEQKPIEWKPTDPLVAQLVLHNGNTLGEVNVVDTDLIQNNKIRLVNCDDDDDDDKCTTAIITFDYKNNQLMPTTVAVNFSFKDVNRLEGNDVRKSYCDYPTDFKNQIIKLFKDYCTGNYTTEALIREYLREENYSNMECIAACMYNFNTRDKDDIINDIVKSFEPPSDVSLKSTSCG